MRKFIRFLTRSILVLGLALALLWFLGPRETVDTEITFAPSQIGEGIDAYFENSEAKIPGIHPEVVKQVVWAGEANAKTPIAVVYLHGFSATSMEIRPLPDMVAQGLSANLVLTRLAGHGRDGDAMAKPTAGDWLNDTAEALAVARRVGEKVIVIGTSTGGTLAAVAALDKDLSRDVIGTVFLSPNFKAANPLATILTWPLARYWVPIVGGETREWTAANDRQEEFWNTSYPLIAALPMGALVKHAAQQDYTATKMPALFIFSDKDQVIDHQKTRAIAKVWGGPMTLAHQDNPVTIDTSFHVIAGDILSPEMNAPLAELILGWAAGL